MQKELEQIIKEFDDRFRIYLSGHKYNLETKQFDIDSELCKAIKDFISYTYNKAKEETNKTAIILREIKKAQILADKEQALETDLYLQGFIKQLTNLKK